MQSGASQPSLKSEELTRRLHAGEQNSVELRVCKRRTIDDQDYLLACRGSNIGYLLVGVGESWKSHNRQQRQGRRRRYMFKYRSLLERGFKTLFIFPQTNKRSGLFDEGPQRVQPTSSHSPAQSISMTGRYLLRHISLCVASHIGKVHLVADSISSPWWVCPTRPSLPTGTPHPLLIQSIAPLKIVVNAAIMGAKVWWREC